MCDNLSISDKLTRVREKLNSEKVQLWTSPYYITGMGPSDEDLQVKIEENVCFSLLSLLSISYRISDLGRAIQCYAGHDHGLLHVCLDGAAVRCVGKP